MFKNLLNFGNKNVSESSENSESSNPINVSGSQQTDITPITDQGIDFSKYSRDSSGNLNYDFYSFDIGKPTSRYKNVGDGIGYKEHENGFVAYNINKSEKSFKRTNGQTVKVPKKRTNIVFN